MLNRLALSASLGLLAALPASAQDGLTLDGLHADRLNPRQVLVEFAYDGGACEEVGAAQLGEMNEGTLAVTFPTVSTAEICTMQIVKISVREAVLAGPDVVSLEVTLQDPEGAPMASWAVSIEGGEPVTK
ncbi:MAG: hypothetical protein RLP98_14685 [Devosia sp.]